MKKEFKKKEFKKKGKGYDVFVDGYWMMWVIGSIANAKKELKKELKKID